METVNAPGRQVYKSMFCIASIPLPHRVFIIDNQVEPPLSFPRFTSIASSHAIIFSGVVRAALGNISRAEILFARRFSREIFLVTTTSISLLLSPTPLPRFAPPRISMYCFPSRRGAERPKLSQVYLAFLPLLYRPALHSPFCFHRRATSRGTSMRLLLSDLPHPFLFVKHRREHSQSQRIKFLVCMQITSRGIFLRLLAPPACYFPVNTPSFLPSSRCVNICYPPNSDRRCLAVDRKRKALATSLNYFVSKPRVETFPLESGIVSSTRRGPY